MSENSSVCAYLDLLGFKYFLDKDLEGALNMLYVSHTGIYNILREYRNIAERHSLTSFDYFLPFSDSIFIQSSKPALFVDQLSCFLLDTFLYHAFPYSHSESQNDPSKVTIDELSLDIGRNLTVNKKPAYWFPVIFKGGIDYGNCYCREIYSIKEGKLTLTPNLIGKSVVKAVSLEKEITGPRIICTQAFYEAARRDDNKNKLDRYIVRMEVAENKEILYEIYWTAFHFSETNDCEFELINSFEALFGPAVKYWKENNHLKCSLHYYNFLKLIVKSTLRFYSFEPAELGQARNHISCSLKREGLENKTDDLMDSPFT